MKVTFIIWYNETTPQIVDVLKSIISSSGPTKISILAIKTSKSKQPEDSAVRWTPGCEVIYLPEFTKKLALQQAIKYLISSTKVSDCDFMVFCEPYFIAETPIFNDEYNKNLYRIYVPYSDQYGESKPEPTSKIIKNNPGGYFIMVGRDAFYNFRSMPAFLENYCIDYYIIDHLSYFGNTCHKMPGCYVRSIKKPPPTSKERKIFSVDLSNYESWCNAKGGYNGMIANYFKSISSDCFYSEENCE